MHAQQALGPIEDRLSAEMKRDAQVNELVRELKVLRKRLSAMGAKHPSRKLFEDRIRLEEESLQNRLKQINPSLAVEEEASSNEKNSNSKPNDAEIHGSLPDLDAIETPWNSDVGKEKIGGGKEEAIAQLNEDFRSESDASLELLSQDAYPWLKTKGFQDAGYFPGTNRMWGIEPITAREGNSKSWVIWQWEDNWREKRRSLFWSTPKPIVAFATSNNYHLDGLSFVLCRDMNPEGLDQELVEVWAIETKGSELIERRGQVICKFKRGSEKDRLSLYYDPINCVLKIAVLGQLQLTEKCESIAIKEVPRAGLVASLSSWIRNPVTQPLVKINDLAVFQGESIVAGIGGTQYIATQELRPFWRKRGFAPTITPTWWGDRGQRILKHTYDRSKTSEENGSSLWERIASLKPGDLLLVQPGEYTSLARLDIKAQGTATAPIVVQGQGAGVVINRPNADENVINIKDSSFLALGGIEVTGGGTGIRIETANELFIYNSIIHDIANVGVALNSKDTSSIYIVDNEIFRTDGNGEGIYVGSHDGDRTTRNSFFVGNYIHDLASGAENQGDGIEIKNQSYGNLVKWNYIIGTKYPGITVYGAGGSDNPVNVIQENIVLDCMDSGIQVAADALVQGNWISGRQTGIVSKPFGNLEPRNIRLLGNTIASDSACIKVNQWNRSDNWIANNIICSRSRNYFPAGYGKALFISNQLICDLDSLDDLSKIGRKASNRLISSSDLFGNDNPAITRIGAVQQSSATDDTDAIKKRLNMSGHLYYFPKEGILQFVESGSMEGAHLHVCLTEDLKPLSVSYPLLQVGFASGEGNGIGGRLFSVTIFDRKNGILYRSEADRLEDSSTMVFKKFKSILSDVNEMGFTSNGEILFIDGNGLNSASF
ncbi:MAG: right-handed parallel beta-helix repeat-containing protein [Pirellula sp.]